MNWYCTFLVRRPFLMIVGVGILSIACIIVSLLTKSFPDFSDPTKGFEARGTEIGKRLTAWKNLDDQTTRYPKQSGKLFANPNDLIYPEQESEDLILKRLHRKQQRKHKKKNELQKTLADDFESDSGESVRKHEKDHKKKKKGKGKNLKHKLKELKEYASNGTETWEPDEWNGDSGVFRDYETTLNETASSIDERHEHWQYGKNTTFIDDEDHKEHVQSKKNKWKKLRNSKPPINDLSHIMSEGFFCSSLTKGYSAFVVERIGPNSTDSLFDINSLLAMCQLEEQITSVKNYGEYCEKEMSASSCCRSWSIPSYVALLSNKSSCFDIDQDDVATVQSLLTFCFEYYHNFKLDSNCADLEEKCRVPIECTKHNAVFNILHFLTDVHFIKTNDSNVFLKYALIFLPVPQTVNILPLFHNWEDMDLKNELVQVAAMDLGLKNALFDECLITDAWLVALGGVFVMTCIWLYTSSILATFMTLVAVMFSLGMAYFIYTLVFEMTFFPFMNLLAVVVMIGIGADGAFIFVKIWQCTLAERMRNGPSTAETDYRETLQNLMWETLKHAAVSMFVTSITTAGAFFASYFSSITAVKCFGVFAGTAIITNYILMITWLPATISIMEHLPYCCENNVAKNVMQKLNKSINRMATTLEGYIISGVMNLPWLWVGLLGGLGILSGCVVLYYPGLQLPESPNFQLFDSRHPFEVYDAKFKDLFWFEKENPMQSFDNLKLPLRFVWGIQPIDDGDYTNPDSRGELHFDNNFNISSIESQVWLLEFCKRLKEQPFYQPTLGLLLPNCFIENFISFMNRICIDSMDGLDRSPCCDVSKFPFEPHIFELCLPQIISSLYATPRTYFRPGVAGPKFVRGEQINGSNVTQPPITKALVIEFESNVPYSQSYADMALFVETVQSWFDAEIARNTTPSFMANGWFTSELGFFDLQDTLSKGTVLAIGMAMAASMVVLLFVTFNVLISLYAVVTVTFTIFTTVAILIFLGWKLNILESVSVSTAIGLAVDFSLHYGIHYRLSPVTDRVSATKFALSRIIGPTAMAAITTGLAGALMLGSTVLPYIQIGIFLVVVMSVSWVYATFFLTSLLKLLGPQHDFMQFSYPKFKTRPKANGNGFYERKPSQTIATEQLLTPSSSAVGDLLNSESHELDSLTSNSLVKPISECYRPPFDYDRAFNRRSTNSRDLQDLQSPSVGSAVTVVLPEDPDVKV